MLGDRERGREGGREGERERVLRQSGQVTIEECRTGHSKLLVKHVSS